MFAVGSRHEIEQFLVVELVKFPEMEPEWPSCRRSNGRPRSDEAAKPSKMRDRSVICGILRTSLVSLLARSGAEYRMRS